MRIEDHNLGGTGAEPCEVYPVESRDEYWASVTGIPCPVDGCKQTVVWYEAGYSPGYRFCMAHEGGEGYDESTKRHCFVARGDIAEPTLIRDTRFEREG